MKRKKEQASATAAKTAPELPNTFYRLKALLQTVRCIAQHEDALCTLLHEIQQSQFVSEVSAIELTRLLAELPSHEYLHDLQAVEESMEMSAAPSEA